MFKYGYYNCSHKTLFSSCCLQKAGFEVEIFDSTKNVNSVAHEQTTLNSINHSALPSTSHDELDDTESFMDEASTSSIAPSSVAQRTTR